MECLFYLLIILILFVSLVFWVLLPGKDEEDINPYS